MNGESVDFKSQDDWSVDGPRNVRWKRGGSSNRELLLSRLIPG